MYTKETTKIKIRSIPENLIDLLKHFVARNRRVKMKQFEYQAFLGGKGEEKRADTQAKKRLQV